MDVLTTPERMTADEFLVMPPLWTGRSRQLIDGKVVLKELSWAHGAICFALHAWEVGEVGRGSSNLPVPVLLDDRNVYLPDIVWYRDGRAPTDEDLAPYPTPDIAVEVRSRFVWHYDIGIKKATYERRGVSELWLVDTAADVVLVFRRSTPVLRAFDTSEELDLGATLTSPLLPSFALPVAEIFGS